jgi:cyclohexa-1,5-dienecarbonyl-CoA hydratase
VPKVRADQRATSLQITLERPPLNVLDVPTIRALQGAVAPLRERTDLRTVVFRSGLAGTFSAGADVRDHTRERAPEMLEAFHGLIRLLDALPQSTLAAVDGLCLGGGCELALFCDVVLATPRATFGQPEIDLACFPPVAAAWLTRLAPRAAYEMVLGGAAIPAAEAAAAGLITRVVEDLDGATQEWVERLAGKSAAALAAARRALRTGATGSFDDALARLEALYVADVLPSDDATEGVAAFLEKRPPSWRNR